MDITTLESVLEAETNLNLVRNNYGADFFLKNGAEEGGQTLREKWVLLKFINLHKVFKKQVAYIKKNISRENSLPDFSLYDNQKNLMHHVEITEVIIKGRKRNEEDLNICELINSDSFVISDFLEWIKNAIFKKEAKKYPDNTSLLIYENCFPVFIYEKDKRYLDALKAVSLSTFESICILSANGENLYTVKEGS